MIKYTSDHHIFIEAGPQPAAKYHPIISEEVREHFGNGPFEDLKAVTNVLQYCYEWTASVFQDLVLQTNDVRFVDFLFANHESSILLYIRRIAGEDLEETEGISENVLSLNRRILKLALEQTCDVDYTYSSVVTSDVKAAYIAKVEELLYLGGELYGFAEHLAENRMIKDCNRVYFDQRGLLFVERKHHYDHIYEIMEELFNDGFREGIVSTEIVVELKEKLKECMGIDYDFAGGVIFEIMRYHSGSTFQTVEPSVLPQNLAARGTDEKNAAAFYEGLTISRNNKQKITDAVYKVNSFERYMFRPILITRQNGEDRALVGKQKWAESIAVMATNGFQWQKAPKEWMVNECFNNYLSQKAMEHDKLLEDEAEKVLQSLQIPFYRHVLNFRNAAGKATSIDKPGIGEMDFVFIDTAGKKIVVADCKYNRARYEMVGFSTDYKNFVDQYEPKLQRKINWLQGNIGLVTDEFHLRYPNSKFNQINYSVIGMFIINTPTFYMMNGDYRTVTISNLRRFIEGNYSFPVIRLRNKDAQGRDVVTEMRHPYFRPQ